MIKYLPVYALLLIFVFYTSGKKQDKGVVIQNSGPKGGPYTHPTGERFGRGIFRTRVSNETDSPVELTINFPADSFPIPSSAGSYFKLFLPPDTMTLAKESLYDYGATGLLTFFDTSLHKSTRLQKTVNPKEEYLFYTALLMHVPDNGPVRTGIVLNDKDLFYKVSIGGQLDSALIPCGHIIYKK
ncbi:hypothetical protein [Spirosoma endbachense]|uniref:Uncharacterized protein n=1 Tax=Spirosoma endbachense TaxID=2666025 RepID=A0A6P1VV42_9BACT|nr:hypothetical protein [Spirosoma endbachense]QHV96494.1 hypothetical protein GJR95_16390 [Spirosoma endbachense]